MPRGVKATARSRVVEVVRDERGALQETEDVSRQRALEAASVHPGRVLNWSREPCGMRTNRKATGVVDQVHTDDIKAQTG